MQLCEGPPRRCAGTAGKGTAHIRSAGLAGYPLLANGSRSAGSIAQCQEIDAVLDTVICKNLFLCNRQETQFYLLMMPGDKAFKTKDLSPNWRQPPVFCKGGGDGGAAGCDAGQCQHHGADE